MKIVLFGTGQYYQKKKKQLKILNAVEIIAFLDNSASLWGKQLDGVMIYNPISIQCIEYDYVIIMSELYSNAMKEQLKTCGVLEKKILDFDTFVFQQGKGNIQIYLPTKVESCQNKVLFITSSLDYVGGILAVLYAALACKELGYMPVVMAPEGNENLIEEYRTKGITFCLYYNLCREAVENFFWLKDFSIIFVNTFQMKSCVEILGKEYHMIWWIHEPVAIYESYKELCKEFPSEILERVSVYSVTSYAKKNFQKYFPKINSDILTLGIPDTYCKKDVCEIREKKLIFAVIGVITYGKGHDLLLKAMEIEKLSQFNSVEYWFIGAFENDFAKKILASAENKKNIKILGQKTRKEMEQLYSQIDVVIVCSREETLSIVAIEAMMYEKVCIVSDACGIIDYLTGKEKELVYHKDSIEELADKILWCINNKKELKRIGKEARSIYEQEFSMEVFKKRLNGVLEKL